MKSETEEGKAAMIGLDIGTSRMVAVRAGNGQQTVHSELNAFLTLPYSRLTESSLEKESIPFARSGGQIVVIGNESARMADLLGREVRRPMTRGMLNPQEPESLELIREIISTVTHPEETAGAKVCFSLPAPPLGGDDNLTFHEATVRQILEQLGYQDVRSVNEGVAAVYSEMEESNYTGIGISCGGGLCNVAMAYLSVPVLAFSVSKGGDFIDASAAGVTGEMVNRVRLIKEESFHFNGHYTDKIQQALSVYYDDMIQSILEGLRQALQSSRNVPKFGRAVPVVLSGGGVMPDGFRERFEKAVGQANLPVSISGVRVAKNPLETTARGALAAVLSE